MVDISLLIPSLLDGVYRLKLEAAKTSLLHYLVSLQTGHCHCTLPLCILFARLANIFAKADLRQFELSKDMEIKWDE